MGETAMTKFMLLWFLFCATVSIAGEGIDIAPAVRGDGTLHFSAHNRRDPFCFVLKVPDEVVPKPEIIRPNFDIQAEIGAIEKIYGDARARFVSGDYLNS